MKNISEHFFFPTQIIHTQRKLTSLLPCSFIRLKKEKKEKEKQCHPLGVLDKHP